MSLTPTTAELHRSITELQKQLTHMRLQTLRRRTHRTYNPVVTGLVTAAQESARATPYCHDIASERLEEAEAMADRYNLWSQ